MKNVNLSGPLETERSVDADNIDEATMNDDEILAYHQSPLASKVAKIIDKSRDM